MSSHDYHIAAETDLKPRVSRHIWFYLVLLALGLFITMWGLIIMFRFQVATEKEQKIGQVFSHELLDKKAMSEAYLSGKQGLFPDKKHEPITESMRRFLVDFRRER